MTAPSGRRGRLVRPYLVTKGRTRATTEGLALETLVMSTGSPSGPGAEPEHRALLDLCREPASVVDLSAGLTLPIGVIRVLIGDLSEDGSLTVYDDVDPDLDVVRRLIERVRAI